MTNYHEFENRFSRLRAVPFGEKIAVVRNDFAGAKKSPYYELTRHEQSLIEPHIKRKDINPVEYLQLVTIAKIFDRLGI